MGCLSCDGCGVQIFDKSCFLRKKQATENKELRLKRTKKRITDKTSGLEIAFAFPSLIISNGIVFMRCGVTCSITSVALFQVNDHFLFCY